MKIDSFSSIATLNDSYLDFASCEIYKNRATLAVSCGCGPTAARVACASALKVMRDLSAREGRPEASTVFSELLIANFKMLQYCGITDAGDSNLIVICHQEDNNPCVICFGGGVVLFETTEYKKLYIREYEEDLDAHFIYSMGDSEYFSHSVLLTERVMTFSDKWELLEDETRPIENRLLGINDILFKQNAKRISVFTNGVKDIILKNLQSMPVEEAVKSLVSFKDTDEHFVKRHMRHQLAEWSTVDGISTTNDIAMATLIINE